LATSTNYDNISAYFHVTSEYFEAAWAAIVNHITSFWWRP